MTGMPVKSERLGALDSTQIHDIYKQQVDCVDRRDLKGLSELYHKDAIIIANKEVSRLTRPAKTGSGRDKVQNHFEAYLDAGLGRETVWEYVQGTNAFLVRARVQVRDTEKDTFGYYAIRDGKIWRHITGIEDDGARSPPASVDPAKMNPMFGNLAKGLESGRVDNLMKYYTPKSVALFAASKSWGFRVRGAAEGHDDIRAFLTGYMKGGAEVGELREYIEQGDTIYIHGLMKRAGVVSSSYGGYVLQDGLISTGWSTT